MKNKYRDLMTVCSLDLVFADEIPKEFEPVDEILEGVLTAGDSSILFGDSNSGKTFFVVNLGCAMALGIPYLGRRTEKGIVVYLAAESPASVMRRLQAYQKHHNVRVTGFVIVKNPINLFDGDVDANAIIDLIRDLEKQSGEKIILVIGDTLARLSAGANENAGQDMGIVVKHVDRIRNECKTHFMLIHHSGKNAAAGARGWSGIRAAVDTEIEVTDSPNGRCVEITKQRDLNTKGVRIGFDLEIITLGVNKWGEPATSCVVTPADAPIKAIGKRQGSIAPDILEHLNINKNGIKKTKLVKNFDKYTSSAVYREIKKLEKDGRIIDSNGLLKILVPTGAD